MAAKKALGTGEDQGDALFFSVNARRRALARTSF